VCAGELQIWNFIKPLEWKLWVVFVCTLVLLPFMIWCVPRLGSLAQ
jgi:hypothetical protein